jgi:hypothetical protein
VHARIPICGRFDEKNSNFNTNKYELVYFYYTKSPLGSTAAEHEYLKNNNLRCMKLLEKFQNTYEHIDGLVLFEVENLSNLKANFEKNAMKSLLRTNYLFNMSIQEISAHNKCINRIRKVYLCTANPILFEEVSYLILS